ncbi:hypothetical protein [Methanoculleus sp. DTU007]|uniref:DUF7524 family protein n=1 Tax=Methanoculleus TaxID=45989 RepID=UPI000AF84C0B|nr:hypothetical protein [Methanoculleus sp. DTU007]NLN09027.1 hypothetical protein [Methanoculleus thermophilus]HQD26954.1 hypothetical protein [Methanoculleus thermophilus]
MPEIHLNSRGINAIAVPDEVEATPGSDLVLHIINHGSPLHITIASSNSAAFTDFFHENLYVNKIEEFSIPIRENACPGTFSLEVIAGYGAKRAEFRVVVKERPDPEPAPEPEPVVPEVARPGIPLPPATVLVPCVIALLLYGLWLMLGIDLLNAAAFAALLLGVILTWLRQRS